MRNDSEPRDERLVDYLLGRLSDEEAEPYDERSIADEDFVWRLRAVENDLIDAYVRGSLTGDTRRRFETVYMASPRRRERVMFARSLPSRVDRLEPPAEPAAATLVAGPGTARSRTARWLMAAAALALAATGALVGRQQWLKSTAPVAAATSQRSATLNASADAAADAPAPLAPAGASPAAVSRPATTTAPLTLSPETRAVASVATLAIPAGADLAAFTLRLESDDFRRYRATLKEPATDRVVWRSDWTPATVKDDVASVSIAIPTAQIGHPQHYAIELSGRTDAGGADLVASYVFEVVRR